jgi:hypothetical protein
LVGEALIGKATEVPPATNFEFAIKTRITLLQYCAGANL